MPNFDDKINKNIAELAAKIMNPTEPEVLTEVITVSVKVKPEFSFKKVKVIKESTENKTQFSTLLEAYHNTGIKSIFNVLSEEPDNETFTKEVDKAKKKASEKTPDNEIAKPAVQAVKNEDTINEVYYKLVSPSGEVHSKHANESAALSIKDSSPSYKSYKVVPVIGESVDTKMNFSEFKKQSVAVEV